MEIITPDYFNHFRCLASACPDSCCKEWDVQVDDASAAVFRALPGPLGQRLRAVLVEEDGSTFLSQSDHRCPMWRQDGLCEIQAVLGEDHLCQVCREYPRLRHDYGDFVELGLELSCPEAARLILSSPAYGYTIKEVPGGEPPEYDREAMHILKATRAGARDILTQRDLPLGQALSALLLYGYAAQEMLDCGSLLPFSISGALEEAASLGQPGQMEDIFRLYLGLEVLTSRWKEMLEAGPVDSSWSVRHQAFVRYLIDRYWLQAISDGDLVGRVKFIITSCLLVKFLGGDIAETAQLYSKEIENDADNVDALLDAAYASPALTDVKLLGLLLNA